MGKDGKLGKENDGRQMLLLRGIHGSGQSTVKSRSIDARDRWPERGEWNADEVPVLAMRAAPRRKLRVDCIDVPFWWRWRRIGAVEESSTDRQVAFSASIGKEAVVSDPLECGRQDVKKESAEEFHGGERHVALPMSVLVVFPAERDASIVDGEEALIGDRDPVCVAGKVLENLLWASEGWLGVDDPFPGASFVQKFPPDGLVFEEGGISVEG